MAPSQAAVAITFADTAASGQGSRACLTGFSSDDRLLGPIFHIVSSMLASDLIALAIAIIGLAIACLISRRVRKTVLELAKGPWYVPTSQDSLVAETASVADGLTVSLWASSIRTVSAVATAIVVLQAGASLTALELSANSGTHNTTLPFVVRMQA